MDTTRATAGQPDEEAPHPPRLAAENGALRTHVALLRSALLLVRHDVQTATETWRDGPAGPATVPGEPGALTDLSEETVAAVEDALSATAAPSDRRPGAFLVVACPSAATRGHDELRVIYGIRQVPTAFVASITPWRGTPRWHVEVRPLDRNGENWLMRYSGDRAAEEDRLQERLGEEEHARIEQSLMDDVWGQVVGSALGMSLGEFRAEGHTIGSVDWAVSLDSPEWFGKEPPVAVRLLPGEA